MPTLNKSIEDAESTLVESYDTATASLAERFDELSVQLSERLEAAEEDLPAFPKKVVAYNRAVADRAFARAHRANELVVDAVRPVVRVADTGVRTVVGTARWAAERTGSTALDGLKETADQARSTVERAGDVARDGLKETTGQARAQAEKVTTTFRREATELVDEATEAAVEAERDVERRTLRSMTKAELYDMAQDLDIEGRGDMKKAELVEAIVHADDV